MNKRNFWSQYQTNNGNLSLNMYGRCTGESSVCEMETTKTKVKVPNWRLSVLNTYISLKQLKCRLRSSHHLRSALLLIYLDCIFRKCSGLNLQPILWSRKTGKAAFDLGRSLILRSDGLNIEMKILPWVA